MTTSTATLMNIADTANQFAAKIATGKRFFGARKIADKLYNDETEKQVFIIVYLSAIAHLDIIMNVNTWTIARVETN